jgi:hypothetical protein
MNKLVKKEYSFHACDKQDKYEVYHRAPSTANLSTQHELLPNEFSKYTFLPP